MSRKSRSRKNSVLSTTKKVGMKSVGLLEKGLSGLFGVVKTGVEMGLNKMCCRRHLLSHVDIE